MKITNIFMALIGSSLIGTSASYGSMSQSTYEKKYALNKDKIVQYAEYVALDKRANFMTAVPLKTEKIFLLSDAAAVDISNVDKLTPLQAMVCFLNRDNIFKINSWYNGAVPTCAELASFLRYRNRLVNKITDYVKEELSFTEQEKEVLYGENVSDQKELYKSKLKKIRGMCRGIPQAMGLCYSLADLYIDEWRDIVILLPQNTDHIENISSSPEGQDRTKE